MKWSWVGSLRHDRQPRPHHRSESLQEDFLGAPQALGGAAAGPACALLALTIPDVPDEVAARLQELAESAWRADASRLYALPPICACSIPSRTWAISSITLSELLHGLEKSAAPELILAAVENFCSSLDVLPYGPKASLHFGQIRAALERRGRPIGVNDLNIATGLLVENWARWSTSRAADPLLQACLPVRSDRLVAGSPPEAWEVAVWCSL